MLSARKMSFEKIEGGGGEERRRRFLKFDESWDTCVGAKTDVRDRKSTNVPELTGGNWDLDVRRSSSYRRASSSTSIPLTPADDGGRTSSWEVVCAKGWMGALSGPGSGVGDKVSSSLLPVRNRGEEGIRIFKLDLSSPFDSADSSVGLDDIIWLWAIVNRPKC